MNGKQLKNSILQWAIQGKLVPQDPNDEPASVLLERIRVEKAKFVKEKKIKKDKNESIIYRGDDNSYYEKFLATGEVKCIDDEIPFEIPQGWEWCRLKHMCSMQAGKNISASEIYDEKSVLHPYRCVGGNGLRGFTNTFNAEGHFAIIGRQGALCGCLNMESGKFYATEHAVVVNGFGIIPSLFIYYFFTALNLNQYATATAQPGLAVSNIVEVFIPLPPLPEQLRIVSKIEKLLPLVKTYEQAQNGLNELNASLNEQLRKSILQEAIQGKLVPQIAEEGTAEKLLTEISEEKERLIKEGKLKKSALTDSIIFKGDDNKYYERINGQIIEIELSFEYPNSWTVLRLKDICQLIDGEKRNGKGVCLDAKYLRGKSSSAIVEKGKFVYAGDNIILVDGENSGEVFLVPQDGYMGSTFKQLWLSSVMWKPYVLAFILFYKEELRNSKRGAAIPHLNKELFYNLPIGIPPLAEQQRITERVNELSQLLK
jgi:type I restriction enzyme S subunit